MAAANAFGIGDQPVAVELNCFRRSHVNFNKKVLDMQSALIIFVLTYFVIAVQNVLKIHISRPAGSLLGAVFMVLFCVLTL